MRIVDGWHTIIKMGYTWGFGWTSIFFIIIGLCCLAYCLNNKNHRIFNIFCVVIAIGYMVCAYYCKPVTKTVTEYLIECNETAQVNDFFDRFELQEIVDESHYIVRIKNWKDQLN